MELWWPGANSSVQDNYWYAPSTARYPHLTSFSTNYRWLVLKCTLSDNRTVPEHLDSLINSFLTPQGAGPGNVTDYSDVSYGAVSFSTDVHGWYSAPFNGSEPGISGPGNRYNRVQVCADAIPPSEAAKINFGDSRFPLFCSPSNIGNRMDGSRNPRQRRDRSCVHRRRESLFLPVRHFSLQRLDTGGPGFEAGQFQDSSEFYWRTWRDRQHHDRAGLLIQCACAYWKPSAAASSNSVTTG